MPQVLLEKRDGYAIVTLNRPEAMNALSRDLRREFVAVFDDCCRDEAVRVIILTGAGEAFCAGFDLKELASGQSANAAEEVNNALAEAMAAFEGPIIGAINGHAVTGGFEMALACDILLASEAAHFADTHARVGILPGWGLSQKLPRLIGLSRAKEMAFSGAPVFAAQAYDWGLVNHVLSAEELLPRAIQLAETICAAVPSLLPQYKRLIDDGYSMPLQEALVWEERQAIASARKVQSEMVAARLDGVMARGRSEKKS